MSSVDPLSDYRSSTNSSARSQQLGQNEFLKLMVAQLKNQDPMKPLDPNEFLGQLAQFSTVTGIQNMDTSIATLSEAMRSTQVLSGSSLIGRDVLIATNKVTVAEGESVHGAVEIPAGASQVKLNIYDSTGTLVRTISLPKDAGTTDFTWDGLTSTGEPVKAGTYKFEIIASAEDGSASLEPMLATRVNSVTIDPISNQLSLNTNVGTLALSRVRRVM